MSNSGPKDNRPGNGAGSLYRVVLSDQVKSVVESLHAVARQSGVGPAFVAAFRAIAERLRTDPLVFGEPSFRLPALQLHVRRGAVSPLLVDYAVHEEQHLVFVQVFKILS